MAQEPVVIEHLHLDLETLRRVAASVIALAAEVDKLRKCIEAHIREKA